MDRMQEALEEIQFMKAYFELSKDLKSVNKENDTDLPGEIKMVSQDRAKMLSAYVRLVTYVIQRVQKDAGKEAKVSSLLREVYPTIFIMLKSLDQEQFDQFHTSLFTLIVHTDCKSFKKNMLHYEFLCNIMCYLISIVPDEVAEEILDVYSELAMPMHVRLLLFPCLVKTFYNLKDKQPKNLSLSLKRNQITGLSLIYAGADLGVNGPILARQMKRFLILYWERVEKGIRQRTLRKEHVHFFLLSCIMGTRVIQGLTDNELITKIAYSINEILVRENQISPLACAAFLDAISSRAVDEEDEICGQLCNLTNDLTLASLNSESPFSAQYLTNVLQDFVEQFSADFTKNLILNISPILKDHDDTKKMKSCSREKLERLCKLAANCLE